MRLTNLEMILLLVATLAVVCNSLNPNPRAKVIRRKKQLEYDLVSKDRVIDTYAFKTQITVVFSFRQIYKFHVKVSLIL